MFRRTFNPQVFVSMLAVLIGASVPALLVLINHLDSNLLPSMLSGIALYFIFFRKRNTNSVKEEA